MIYDVAVIGAGIIGALTARELAKYKLSAVLIEKCNDVAMGTTKANSAIVHAGFDAVPGTKKAIFNVLGAERMPKVTSELSVPYRNNGSLVVAFSEEELPELQNLLERGIKNGVKDLKILSKEELLELEPNISPEAVAALHAPTAGIVCPYEFAIAATENAVTNGVEFIRNCEVKDVEVHDDYTTLITNTGDIKAKVVVNAAGVFSDDIARMFGDDTINIVARKGEYYLFDKAVGHVVFHTVFQCPTPMGKGVLVTPTVDGNLLIGPTAVDIEDKNDTSTTYEGLMEVLNKAHKSVPTIINTRDAITQFSGLRAHAKSGDFIIGFSEKAPSLYNLAGIESPGLSAAPAIAVHAAQEVANKLGLTELKEDYNPIRPQPIRFRYLDDEEMAELIKQDPRYGRIICRCETITEGEIVEAIHAPAGARDIDGVKRRTRAGMGRCQGGFCSSKVLEILARELNIPYEEVTKEGGNSRILYGRTK